MSWLKWWGIVEPSIEDKRREEKPGSKNSDDAESRQRSRRDRIGARPESGRDEIGDRYRGDNSRNTRKRSSRDRYDDEYGYFDDYPRREDRHDRYPDRRFDEFRDGYPPPTHNRDFDRDYDRPMSRYPESHPPHDHGGRQPLPPRTRDGSHSRQYPFDGPPPGPPRSEFRGGSRHYEGGGPPPRDYPHRDPYGPPPGRGPPPPRDDRRDYRDRDDGRHSGRSNRNDRARPLR